MEGSVYVLTNPAMPNMVKIGKTTRNVALSLSDLYSTGVPLPFECEYAAKVKDVDKTEKAFHTAFSPNRVNPKREFLNIDPEQAIAVLELMAIEDVTPSQLEINDLYQNLLDDYLNSIDCNFDILSRIKFEPFKDENGATNTEANKNWYINMDASFNTICSDIKISIDSDQLDSYITTTEAKINRFSQQWSVRYNVIDEDLEEIFNNIDSFQKSLIFFTSNITSIKENFQLQPFDEQEFYTHNVTSYLLANTILNHITFILSNKDNAEQLEMIKNRFKIIKVCLKFIMISITKEQVGLRTEVVPSPGPGVLTRGYSQTASDSQNQVTVTPQRQRPPGNRSRVSSLDAVVSPPRAQQAQGATYPTVNFGEYLKLRIKKVEELANYMSSEIINLDTCKSLLENASKVPTLLGEGKLTQKYLLKDKTSVQSQIFVNKFMKKLGENLKEAGEMTSALAKLVDTAFSSNNMVQISRDEYNKYLASKRSISSSSSSSRSSSRLTFSSHEDGGAEKTNEQQKKEENNLEMQIIRLKRKRDETTDPNNTGANNENVAKIDAQIKKLQERKAKLIPTKKLRARSEIDKLESLSSASENILLIDIEKPTPVVCDLSDSETELATVGALLGDA